LVTALTSGVIALVVAAVSGLFTWLGVRRERNKWLTDLAAAWTLERNKTRLAAHPEVLRSIGLLSKHDRSRVTPEVAGRVAEGINGWFYGPGGLIADASTRGALLGLRIRCNRWARTRVMPEDLYEFRNLAVLALRKDLDLSGLESFDFEDDLGMIGKLFAEMTKKGLTT